jgi:hypothetical protein
MGSDRLRTIAVLSCGAALALTGCKATGGASAASSTPTSSAPAVTGSPASHGDSPDAGGGTPSCMGSELRAELQVQTSNSEEKGIGTLILTNRSTERCLLPAGWVPLGTGGPHDYTALPATRTEYPGRGRDITLRPGSSAFAGTKWHTAPDCGTTTGLGAAWHSTWIPVTFHGLNGQKPPVCDHLVLGTLQPTMNGVNFT